MLNDYKGEKPTNVITEEEHRKRPFYKKVSFWVLSALGLFFGGCSVYGLVLGYQYVHAVTEAAHIIAGANDSSNPEKVSSLKKNRVLVGSVGDVAVVDLGSLTWTKSNQNRFHTNYFYNNKALYPASDSSYPEIVCDKFSTDTASHVYWNENENTVTLGYSGNCYVFVSVDYYANHSVADFVSYVSGTYLYYRLGVAGDTAKETFYHEGFDAGYDDGHQDGYQEGYADGSDAINLPQSVKVLLPVGNEYSVQYKTYLDGVVDRQGQLNSSQTGGAYATFDRSRTQKLRIDLTLPSGSRAFFLYSPSWTSAYPTDENYSLRQSWAVSGVTYLPTWISKPQIYVNVTSADVPDLTYETVSVAFDVDHWGDIKLGAYSQGYNDGYQAGEENPTAYDSGYDAGYEQGYDDGHTLGVAQGESQAVSGQKALVNMFVTAFQQPFDQIYRFLNFNVLGLNILALFTALLTLSIGIIIIKKVI